MIKHSIKYDEIHNGLMQTAHRSLCGGESVLCSGRVALACFIQKLNRRWDSVARNKRILMSIK